MDSITYTSARRHLAAALDRTCDSRRPLMVTRRGADPVVLLRLDDFAALEAVARGERATVEPTPDTP